MCVIIEWMFVLPLFDMQKVVDDKVAKAKKPTKGKKDDSPAHNGETKTNEVHGKLDWQSEVHIPPPRHLVVQTDRCQSSKWARFFSSRLLQYFSIISQKSLTRKCKESENKCILDQIGSKIVNWLVVFA